MSTLTGGHSFNLIQDTCSKCGCDFTDWINGRDPVCAPKHQICCGKPGRDRWNANRVWWECSACGMMKSTDPNYLYWRGAKSPALKTMEKERDKEVEDALKFLNGGYWESTPKKTCAHKWKSYTGLKETYEYCEVCDQKR